MDQRSEIRVSVTRSRNRDSVHSMEVQLESEVGQVLDQFFHVEVMHNRVIQSSVALL